MTSGQRLLMLSMAAMLVAGCAAAPASGSAHVRFGPGGGGDASRLAGGIVSSSAPTYDDGDQPRSVSLNTSGELRVAATMAGGAADTELPAAAALSDNAANPTTPTVGAALLAFDGTTFDRVTNGSGTAATALRVELPTNGTGVVGLNAGTANIGDVDVLTINGQAPAFSAGASSAATLRTVTASDDAGVASLGVIDDWDESDRAKVNPIAGQAGVAAGSGTVSALTQRVVLATDVALPAGTNSIGKVQPIGTAATALFDAADTADQAITGAAGGLRLMGFTIRETAGAVAAVTIRNGTGTGDAAITLTNLAASESVTVWYGPDGIASASGIFADRTTGTTELVVYYKTE